MVDLLLRGATIYPGDAEPRRGDVAIDDGVILVVGAGLRPEAVRTIDLAGLALAPGFVDMHAHSALRSFDDPVLEPKLRQGIHHRTHQSRRDGPCTRNDGAPR